MAAMARRGDALRDHILQAAKQVFLEEGFERASMDEVARRANTSKRSLYAHFESKEKLFLAVIELVRELFLGRLKEPAAYSTSPVEALTLFCARYLESMLYEASIRLVRITLAETGRFPEGAAQHYDVMFTEVMTRLASYLKTAFGSSARASSDAAERLLGQILFPKLPRALFGLGELVEGFDERALSPQIDLRWVRRTVHDVVESLSESGAKRVPPRPAAVKATRRARG
jgi:AcrR family transcriptional regulator